MSDCCCELCPRLYHKRCLGMKTNVNSWLCPECQVCAVELITVLFIYLCHSQHAAGTFIRHYWHKLYKVVLSVVAHTTLSVYVIGKTWLVYNSVSAVKL